MATIRFKRGTASQIQAAVAAGTLNEGEPYLETDTGRVNIGTGTNTLTQLASQSDVDAVAQPHTHVAGDVTDGVFAQARLGSGTASVATVLRGDGSWGEVPGMGDVAAALDTILNGA